MNRFTPHCTLDEARELLPQIRVWLAELGFIGERLVATDKFVESLVASGSDAGGPVVNLRLRLLADMSDLVHEFSRREIQLTDIDRGLVDFPTLRDGREVLLCWESDAPDIEYWREPGSAPSSRQQL